MVKQLASDLDHCMHGRACNKPHGPDRSYKMKCYKLIKGANGPRNAFPSRYISGGTQYTSVFNDLSAMQGIKHATVHGGNLFLLNTISKMSRASYSPHFMY